MTPDKTPINNSDHPKLIFKPVVDCVAFTRRGNRGLVPPDREAREDQNCGTVGERLIELAGRTCYDDETEVLTRTGWKTFARLTRGEEVCTFNIKQPELEFLDPGEIIARPFDGKLFVAEGRRFSLHVTPDHNLVVDGATGPKLARADHVFGTRFKVPTQAVYHGSQVTDLEFPGLDYFQKLPNSSNCARHVTSGWRVTKELMPKFAGLLGWYVAEGTIAGGGGAGLRIVIYQKDSKVQPIIDLIESLGLKWHKSVDARNGVAALYINKSPLVRWLQQWGVGSHNIRIPPVVFDWPVAIRQNFIDAAMLGDGHKSVNGRWMYTTRSRGLAEDMQRLLVTSGKPSSVSCSTDRGAPIYRVSAGLRPCAEIKPKNQAWVPYSGMVYCVTTKNRALMIRRSGKVLVCGNCYDSYGKGRSSAEYHEHIRAVGHGSVLEHVSATFHIRGVSRGLTHELIRHRVGTAISQRSTRYVDESESCIIVPPVAIIRDDDPHDIAMRKRIFQNNLLVEHERDCNVYQRLVDLAEDVIKIKNHGATKTEARKAARGAGRAVLGQHLETELIWTVNARALINIIAQRAMNAADAEICRLAMELWQQACDIWPAYFEHMAEKQIDRTDGTGKCFSQIEKI